MLLAEELPWAHGLRLEGKRLDLAAFPLGGIGAGMLAFEGKGGFAQVSLWGEHRQHHEPLIFSALRVANAPGGPVTRVLQGQTPEWKISGLPGSGNGLSWSGLGLPRCATARFTAAFPFALLELEDEAWPIRARALAWSPFIPGNADDSSLPVAAVEYEFLNTCDKPLEAAFSFASANFMRAAKSEAEADTLPLENGFILSQPPLPGSPESEGAFAVQVDQHAIVNHKWFDGGWWDGLTLAWQDIAGGVLRENPPARQARGATLCVPLTLPPGQARRVTLRLAWRVPVTRLRAGAPAGQSGETAGACSCGGGCGESNTPPAANENAFHRPWAAARFASINAVAGYWREQYPRLRAQSVKFTQTLFDATLPATLIESVTANLSILKSPTVLRQADGRLWGWEGCCDSCGCCHGTCGHVWNYQQALAHLFPELERGMRETELNVNLLPDGKQAFRANLPISPLSEWDPPAIDAQLGCIMKLHREWRISGDTEWLRGLWPRARKSLDFCIGQWDPKREGLPVEPHHNTYDIEFWGRTAYGAAYYAGGLAAAARMGEALGDDVAEYRRLLGLCQSRMATELFNGEYYIQITQWEGLRTGWTPDPPEKNGAAYADVAEELNAAGPKYQCGDGCLADGLTGLWLALACGVFDELQPREKIRRHLQSVARYNHRASLLAHANPQRPGYALGNEAATLLCSWPRGGRPMFPMVYSDEAWTGTEHQLAAHMLWLGEQELALQVERAVRARHDGMKRNPFDEYECGHYYARALASWSLLAAWTGLFYDAVSRELRINDEAEPFRAPLFTAGGYGTVEWTGSKAVIWQRQGRLDIQKVMGSKGETPFEICG